MPKTVLIPIADGTEEIEAVTLIDVLRRAGAEVTVASVGELQITASRGVKIVADCRIGECAQRDFDLVVLPGGMPGAEHLRDNEVLRRILVGQNAAGRLYGAICAAPAVVLQTHGLLQDRRCTGHPGFMQKLPASGTAETEVVVDRNCVTSRGPGTAMAFALELVQQLFGEQKRAEVQAPMVVA